MIVEKKKFSLDSFYFEKADRKLPVTIGYETYGTLNEAKDNVVLICHFFTGTSHAAGKYNESDALPGWWDSLIGPDKVIDTKRYFVICCDSLSNINFNNPFVHTTGPATINPETGKPYAMDFPIFTLKDVIRTQKALIDSMGIERLKYVIGPSMGGLQAFMWAKYFPEMVGKLISVVATPMVRPSCLMVPNQLGIEAIMLDKNWNQGDYYDKEPPNAGLLLAFKILLTATRTDNWSHSNFGRRLLEPEGGASTNPFTSFTGKFLVENEIEKTVIARMQFFDANSYIYIAKANTLFDLCEENETLDQALSQIKQPVQMIIDESDLMFTSEQAEEARKSLANCELVYYNSKNGHLSCLYETDYFAKSMQNFMNRN
ncbi:MAG: homoserine O-acetyltransferase/O-succinyltransferase [Clostridiales bacterium]|nr:homoserine O-acetyltransferase/O-succinyltransferase [Clostridiales bacterium]MDN5283287.1 homoserine O-acetyltransferase/O-succinyltransferase [Candidatus Ozemobacter sp.]